MIKLQQLIEEFCIDGVKYRKLIDLADISTGSSNTNEAEDDGIYPFFVRSQDPLKKNSYEYDETAIITAGDGVGVGKVYHYVEGKYALHQRAYRIHIISDELLPKFFFYYMKTKFYDYISKAGFYSSVSSIRRPMLNNFLVPIIPMHIQERIVRVLDEYSASVYSLQQELEKELTARKKQYKYYLNRFFEENKGENKSLASLGTIQRGKRFVHADATDTGVPCIHYGELYTYYGVYTQKVKSHIREDLRDKMRYAKPNDVVIVGAGENKEDIGIGVAWYGNENVAVHDACYILSHDQNPKYISYFLRSDLYHQQIIKYVYEGKICSISAENIGKALIPLPSCDEQAKIVSVLDRLDKLCNDLTNNLPAEIEVRRKQYEYYRDKLLTFKEKA